MDGTFLRHESRAPASISSPIFNHTPKVRESHGVMRRSPFSGSNQARVEAEEAGSSLVIQFLVTFKRPVLMPSNEVTHNR
jgi:hypothetical protein